MSRDSRVLEKLFDQYQIPLDFDDYTAQKDYEWCYYVNKDYSITVDATYNYNKPNEYEAEVYINENDSIIKTFKEGEEIELIKFITTDRLKLAENRKLERIKEDF